MKRIALFILSIAFSALALAQQPIKVGIGISQTGTLGGGGKAALLGLQMWVEDVNKKGGLLGRKVELIAYDDQSNPATTPGIYTKLLDVDKVDLLVAPYGTVPTAPIMPLVKQRDLLLMGNFSFQVNHTVKHDKWFNNAPWGDATSWTEGFLQVGQKAGAKTVAFIAADQEFSKNACDGAKDNAKKIGLRTVYDRAYPPNTTDFTPVVRGIQAANPDVVTVCSYPLDSVGMVKAVNEVGFKPKLIGGAMVGLQATGIKSQLGHLLNGWVNYETWVPDKKMYYEGTDEFFKKYQSRAQAAGVDALGYYLGGWGYAYAQVLEQAVKGANTLNDAQLAAYIKKNAFKTIHGTIEFGDNGEWKKSGMLQVQYHNIKQGAGLETWRGMDYQTVLTPDQYKTGTVIYPYEKAK